MINVENKGLTMTELNDVKGWLSDEDVEKIADIYSKLGENAIDLPVVP